MVNDDAKHSFTYTLDAARGTAVLGNSLHAYNQVWHLPTDKNPMTGREFIEAVARLYGVGPNYSVLKRWMIQLVGAFNPTVKETLEMLYQQEFDYLFDSSKFEKQFFKATTYLDGIKHIAHQ